MYRTHGGRRSAALLLALAVMLAGCYRYEVGTVIGADESGQLTIAILFGPEFQQLAEESGEPLDYAEFDASMPASAELIDVTDGDHVGRQAVIPFESLDELNDLVEGPLVRLREDPVDSALLESFSVTREGSIFAFDATFPEFTNESTGEIDPEIDASGTIEIGLELPGEITEHNADEVDGELLTWQFADTEGPRELMARSRTDPVGGFFDIAGTTHVDAIVWVAEQGITSGYGDGTFRPGETVTRGQMATFLTEALDLPAGTVSFDDAVGTTHEASIAAVAAAGITSGYGDGTFRPGETVTRGQMATFLHAAFELD